MAKIVDSSPRDAPIEKPNTRRLPACCCNGLERVRGGWFASSRTTPCYAHVFGHVELPLLVLPALQTTT